MARSLIIDANNILYRTFFARLNDTDSDTLMGLCHHAALWSLRKYYNLYPADEIVLAFDSYSWRKLYTSDLSECITYQKYKGHRRKNLTPKQLELFAAFDSHVDELYEMLRAETSLLVLKEKYLEADDLIAGYIQQNPDTHHVLVSADKDYMQLLNDHKLVIIDPDSGKPRSLADWDNDAKKFLFEKCMRGDTSDNIISAYPFLRKKKLYDAYTDEFLKENIMNHTYKTLVNGEDGTPIEIELSTRDVYEENKYLIDLTQQPDYIKNQIGMGIDNATINKGKFNYIKFIKFCKKHRLENIINSIDSFVPMLAGKNTRA